ncbi:MAG TPA: hypothetical protein VLU46_02720 [Thermoanaerobaculia bacterium]|nr:hypothetical protein [Thermoanaerobaculia bacterium]
MWTAKRILKELADNARRNRILQSFWKHAEPASRLLAAAQLAKALHFREETLKKMPAEKRADLLASRIGVPEFEQFFEAALLTYHTHHATDMMAAFLDRWGVPHTNGAIEADEYKVPTAADVRSAVNELTSFDRHDVALYLASAGLLMGEEWRAATWPVVDEIIVAR